MRAIAPDGPGRLWLATTSGLVRADVRTGATLRLDRADGLPAAEPVRGAAAIGPAGRLLVGTAEGLVTVDDGALDREAPPAVLTLTAVEAEGQPVAPARWRHGALALPAGTDDLTVGFALLDLADGRKARYRYRLDRHGGTPEPWTDAGARREAVFGQLAPGRYTFRVQAAGADGRWRPAQASLSVSLRAHWWATPWAQGAAVLAVLALAVGAVRTLERQRAERHAEAAHVRRRIADDLHDDLSGRVAALALAVDVAAGDAALAPDARARLAGAARAARSVASDLRDATWAVDSGHDGLDALFDRLETAAQDALAALRTPSTALTTCPTSPCRRTSATTCCSCSKRPSTMRRATAARLSPCGLSPQPGASGSTSPTPGQASTRPVHRRRYPDPSGGAGSTRFARRAGRSGAALTIRSAPGTGTAVSLRLPTSPAPTGVALSETRAIVSA